MKSIIVSFFFLTIAFGDLLVVAITELLQGSGANAHTASVGANRFLLYARHDLRGWRFCSASSRRFLAIANEAAAQGK